MKRLVFILACALPLVAVSQYLGGGLAVKGAAAIQGTPATAPVAENTLTNGLYAYWRLDVGNNWADAGPNALTLLEVGTVEAAAGIITNGAVFDGDTANYLTVQTDPDAFSAIDGRSITIAGWVNLNVTNSTSGFFAKDLAGSNNREYALYWISTVSSWRMSVYTNAATATYVAIADPGVITGSWYYVVGQIDATNLVSRLRVGTTSALSEWVTSATFGGFGPAGSGTNTTTKFTIGGFATVVSCNGIVDEVGFWTRLLTDSEITNLWNSGAGKTYPFSE